MIYGVLILASFVAAFISGSAGFGGALLLLPVVTACVGVDLAVPVLTLAQLIGNLSRMAFGLKEIEWKSVGWFCLTAIPLSALGAFSFTTLPGELTARIIGVVLIGFVVFTLKKKDFKAGKKTLLIGGGVTGLLSGIAGSAGPIGAAIFLSLGLPPVAYIASEATTATAMHLMKTFVYNSVSDISLQAMGLGLIMGAAMIAGTYCANRFIKKIEKKRFQKYVAALLLAIGIYMLVFGA